MSLRPLTLAIAVYSTAATGLSANAPQGQSGQAGRSSRTIEVSRPPLMRPTSVELEEVTIKADAVIGIRLETTIDSEHSKIEDRVVARVTRDVNVKGRTAIPSGARLEGFVTAIERSGKPRDPARVGLRFTTLVLDDGKMRLPIQTETVFRTAGTPAGQTATRVGAGVVVGSILGAVIGGRKGAIIGGSAGAAGGAAAAAASDRSNVTVPAGTTLTVRLTEPLTLLVERSPDSRSADSR